MIDPGYARKIKDYALSIGFDACAICKAESVNRENGNALDQWLTKGYHADMAYMAKNKDIRLDPRLLVEDAKSIIMLALNYYPRVFQHQDNPQFAYYAYGKDYHDVIKEKLSLLYQHCKSLDSNIEGRYFCDTAPLLERYWAAKAGLGWIGKNSLLIIPRKGSYFFLASLIINTELEYDNIGDNKMPSCVNCTKCIDACPTGAICSPRVIDSNKCISYQTIENKGELDEVVVSKIGNRFYGCDICQQVCPWNRFSVSHGTPEFDPSADFLSLTADAIDEMEIDSYQRIFKGSAVKRAKLAGLKRNIAAVKKGKE